MKIKYFSSVLIIFLLIIACSNTKQNNKPKTFTIKVTGSNTGVKSDIEFSGSYAITNSSGQLISKSVDGHTPATYTVEGERISCTFQKKQIVGTLLVTIDNGNSKTSETTDAEYGVVSLTFK